MTRYILATDGVWYKPSPVTDKKTQEETQPEPIWLCSPLKVVALAQDEDNKWGKLIEFTDPDMKLSHWAMPSKLLASPKDLWSAMLDKGIKLSPSSTALELLRAHLSYENPEKRSRLVSRLGWHLEYGAFVFPDAIIGKTVTDIIHQNSEENPYEIKGTVTDWIENIGCLCVGNSRMTMSVSMAFLGPLLLLLGEDGIGVHIQGDSRTGKSTGQYVGASVCGSRKIVKLWRVTDNGLEVLCEQRSDGFLCLDEIGQLSDPRKVGEIVYMIGNGQGKMRSNSNAELRRTRRWRIPFLSSGELSLSDMMSEVGKKTRGGMQIRLLDVPADAGAGMGIFENIHGWESPGKFADDLRDTITLRCYGAPFRVFVERIVDDCQNDEDGLRKMLRDCRDDFVRDHLPAGASGEVRSACARFGLIAIAGELATGFGLTGWEPGAATEGVAKCFRAWLDKRGSVGSYDLETAVKQVTAFVELHHSRFQDIEDDVANIHNRVGLRQKEGGLWHYYVFPEAWKNELCKGFNPKQVAKEMVERGLLIPDSQGKSATSRRFAGHGQLRVYRLSPAIVAGATQDTRTQAEKNQAVVDRLMADPETPSTPSETPVKHLLH